MAEKGSFFRRRNPVRDITKKIERQLGDSLAGDFSLDHDRTVTMSALLSEQHKWGTEYTVEVHHATQDPALFSSTGVRIVTYPRRISLRPIVQETLVPKTRRNGKFVAWTEGIIYDDKLKKPPPLHVPYPIDLTEYAAILDDPRLQRIDRIVTDEPELSSRVRTRTEQLFSLAVSGVNERNKARGEEPVEEKDFVANYKIGQTEARIRYIPEGFRHKKPNYTINFLSNLESEWETYTFNHHNVLVLFDSVIQGKKLYTVAPFGNSVNLANALLQFDENDIIR